LAGWTSAGWEADNVRRQRFRFVEIEPLVLPQQLEERRRQLAVLVDGLHPCLQLVMQTADPNLANAGWHVSLPSKGLTECCRKSSDGFK
jgi:hypothetical protein